MWAWFKKQLVRLAAFFKGLWGYVTVKRSGSVKLPPVKANEDMTLPSSYSQILSTRDSFAELVEKAQEDVLYARKLLQRTDLKGKIDPHILCEVVYLCRKEQGISLRQALANNKISFFALATWSVQNTLLLLKSRLFKVFSPRELAEIYYTHRHKEDFLSELAKSAGTDKYPNNQFIPTLLYIIKKSSPADADEVRKIISKNITLALLLLNECELLEQKLAAPDKTVDAAALKVDPYKVLAVLPNADKVAIQKAMQSKALEVHPDKIQKGSQFKALNEAYNCLSDPAQRKEWDEAHQTPEIASPRPS